MLIDLKLLSLALANPEAAQQLIDSIVKERTAQEAAQAKAEAAIKKAQDYFIEAEELKREAQWALDSAKAKEQFVNEELQAVLARENHLEERLVLVETEEKKLLDKQEALVTRERVLKERETAVAQVEKETVALRSDLSRKLKLAALGARL